MAKIESRNQAPTETKSGVLTSEEKRHLEDSMRHNDKLMKQLARM